MRVFVWFMIWRHPAMRLKASLTKTDCKAITRKAVITFDKKFIFVLFTKTNWVFNIALQIAQFKSAIKNFQMQLKAHCNRNTKKLTFIRKRHAVCVTMELFSYQFKFLSSLKNVFNKFVLTAKYNREINFWWLHIKCSKNSFLIWKMFKDFIKFYDIEKLSNTLEYASEL